MSIELNSSCLSFKISAFPMLPDDAKIILSEISGSSYFSFIYPFTCSSEIGLNFIIVHLDFIVVDVHDMGTDGI